MPWGLERFQQAHCVHFITFSCDGRRPHLAAPAARTEFLQCLEQVRLWYAMSVAGYVVMPEHVHLLLGEPGNAALDSALQMLKQNSSRRLKAPSMKRFWLPRYFDFNVRSQDKFVEKLKYIHRNPVRRGLVERPEDWDWSSFRHYATGEAGVVEVESAWTARRRDRCQTRDLCNIE